MPEPRLQKGWAMWQHQAGRIDFDRPRSLLMQLEWGFRELGPIVGARAGGYWNVIGIHSGARVRGYSTDRRDAGAEAMDAITVLRRARADA